MPYIQFNTKATDIGAGRTARNVSFASDTLADWVGEVDEVFTGEHEIDAATFTTVSMANIAHNAVIIPPVTARPAPTILDVLLASKTLDAADKAALSALKG